MFGAPPDETAQDETYAQVPILSPTCSFPQTGGDNPTPAGVMLAANPALPGCFSG
jgi:hypothetical protein